MLSSAAVIYTRVSSEEQVSNLSLDVQERACREYCARQGWEVIRVYREEGESARTADRTQLKAMLADLRRRPGRVAFVVVYDTSRFARDIYVHGQLKQLLMACGAQLRAATQPLEDSAAGRAIEGVFAVFNQLDNELRAEKVTAGMRETVSRGRWPWRAPLGYLNARTADGRKSIEPCPSAGPLIRRGFVMVAEGVPPAEALERLTALGLRSQRGRELRPQEWRKMLRNSFYRGIAASVKWGIETQGQHSALVDPSTWSRVQAHLDGRAVPGAARTRQRDDFPLRGFVRCSHCSRPLTASWSRGKTGATYAYYRCWGRDCAAVPAVKARAERLEELFGELLRSIQISPGMCRSVEAAMIGAWEDMRAAGKEAGVVAKRRLAELERRKARLVETYVYEQALDRKTYDQQLAGLAATRTELELELYESSLDDLDLEAALGFARHLLTRTYALWEMVTAAQKRELQGLIFPAGVAFDGERLGTPETALLFSILRPSGEGLEGLVEQKGFEPSTPTLRTWCSPS